MTNLLFAGNDYVFDGILTCMLSIVKRAEENRPYRVFILTMDATHLKDTYRPISDDAIAFLDRVVKGYHPESEVIKLDVTAHYRREFDGCPNEGAYCSPYTLLRLLADLLPELPNEKLLYLDADIMFNRDIALLYDTDLGGYEYAAARDHYGKYLIHPNYVNAGVLLFNMPVARASGLFEEARNWIRRKKLTFADQSAIIRATKRKRMLPQKFNDQKFLHRSTVVRHFSKRLFWLPYPHTDNIKQWQVDRVHRVFRYHTFDDILTEYQTLKEAFTQETESKKA